MLYDRRASQSAIIQIHMHQELEKRNQKGEGGESNSKSITLGISERDGFYVLTRKHAASPLDHNE